VWKETPRSSVLHGDKVFDDVDTELTFGLGARGGLTDHAIGVDESQYAKGHKYMTLVYQMI